MSAVIYKTVDGDVLDNIVWQHYNHQRDGVVEKVLAANPGLAEYGAILPAGLAITLPVVAKEPAAQTTRLWT